MHEQLMDVQNAVGSGSKIILLVEDDDVVRMLTCELLAELNYRVLQAEDASQALAIIKSDQPLDLLMTDIGLPDMSGQQLMKAAQQLRPQLPGLFASGYGDSVEIATGAAEVRSISKPYSIPLLRTTLQDLLEQPQ